MKLNKKTTLILAIPFLLSSTAALADHHKGKGEHKGKRNGLCMLLTQKNIQKLNLTPEQQAAFEILKEQGRKQRESMDKESHKKQMQTQREAAHNMIADIILSDEFDSEKVKTMLQQQQEKRDEKMIKCLEKQHKMASILTPEQKEMLKSEMFKKK